MISSEEIFLLLFVVSAPFFGSFISTVLIRLSEKTHFETSIFHLLELWPSDFANA